MSLDSPILKAFFQEANDCGPTRGWMEESTAMRRACEIERLRVHRHGSWLDSSFNRWVFTQNGAYTLPRFQ